MSPRVRRRAATLLLATPVLLALLWAVQSESSDYRDAQRAVIHQARQAAQTESQLIHLRLMQQFQELSFIATGLIGPRLPTTFSGAQERQIRGFIALHPEIFALNVQSADGNRIVWSTHPQPAHPITLGAAFTPLSTHPDVLLGQDHYAPRVGGHVITMRFRVRGQDGTTRYFDGSPYRLRRLLANDARTPFTLTVRDLRDGSTLGVWADGRVTFPRQPPAARTRIAVPDLPLAVDAGWTKNLVWEQFLQGLAERLLARGLIVALLALAAGLIVALLRRSEQLAARNARIAEEEAAARALSDSLFDSLGAIAMVIDTRGNIVRMNTEAERFMGYDSAETQGQPYYWERFIPDEERPRVHNIFEAMRNHTIPREAENHWVSRSGERRLFHWVNTVLDDSKGEPAYLITIGTDITEQTRLARQNRQFAAYNSFLGQVNQLIAQAEDEHGLLQSICELAVRFADVRLAWIGRPDRGGRFTFLAKAGPAVDYLEGIVISVDAELPEGRGSSGLAWREGEPRFNDSFDNNPALHPWRSRAVTHGIEASASLPIRRGGEVWAELVLYAGENGIFDEPLQKVLVQLTRDISHGLELLELRRWHAALLDHSDAGIALVRHRTFISGNTRLASMFGFADLTQLLGQSTRLIYATDAAYEEVGLQYATMEREGVVRLEAVACLRHDGTAMAGDLIGVRLDDENSIWTFVDVTEREQLKRRRIELQRLYQALMSEGEVLLQAETEDAMLSETCLRLVDRTMFHAVWIGRPGTDGAFRPIARAGNGSGVVETFRVPVDHAGTVIGTAWRRNETALHNDHIAMLAESPWAEELRRNRWASALATPIRRGGAPWAVLVFIAPERDAFTAPAIELCERIADLLGHGLDELDRKATLIALQSEEAHRARHDALTGLPNRFALEQYLPQAIARAKRRGTWLGVGMLDLDDFKPVNDRFGHEAGDILLQQLGQRMHGQLRETDFLARLGGDEFVVVFEELDELQVVLQTRKALTRLHRSVERPFDLGAGREAEVGMTLGLAFYPADAHEPDALLRQADAAMYQAKTHKAERVHWWRMGATETGLETEMPFDPFGAESQNLLSEIQPDIERVANDFVTAFYETLAGESEPAEILASLSAPEYAALQRAQAEHLCFLLHPQTSALAITESAERLGRLHALVGVGGAWMSRAMQMYQDLLRAHLEHMTTTARTRYRLLRAASARLQLDIGTQLTAMQTVTDAYNAHLASNPDEAGNWNDQAQNELDALSALPGIRACLLQRPRSDGIFVVEYAAGEVAPALVEVLKQPATRPYLDTRMNTGRGLVPEAWRSGQVQSADAYTEDPRTAAWHEQLRHLDVRSMVAIPVQVESDTMFVLAIQGTFPHQFSSHWMQTFVASMRARWAQLARGAYAQTAPIDQTQATRYRELLYSGGLRMVVQPVVDLHSGELVKAEALARLVTPEGEVIGPEQFLPALGRVDLDALFRMGLEQSLEHLNRWRGDGLELDLSINLAPSTLIHQDCAAWVEAALRESEVAPQHLTLELLETQAFDEAQRSEAIDRLVRLGVQVAIDDLGSGYSSLNRLASLPFDIIKVDQGIIRDIAGDPIKALSLIHSVVQIGHDFDRQVVVEGVENDALIEAVTLLGAQYGQGFGIARPMPAEELSGWMRESCWRPAPSPPIATYLGALAYHWLFMHRSDSHHPTGLAGCPLTGFLERQGLGDGDAARWHAQTHETTDKAVAASASRQLAEWLGACVKREMAGLDAETTDIETARNRGGAA